MIAQEAAQECNLFREADDFGVSVANGFPEAVEAYDVTVEERQDVDAFLQCVIVEDTVSICAVIFIKQQGQQILTPVWEGQDIYKSHTE